MSVREQPSARRWQVARPVHLVRVYATPYAALEGADGEIVGVVAGDTLYIVGTPEAVKRSMREVG